jgi:50S ribosomal subunit-associated GTPase HflX
MAKTRAILAVLISAKSKDVERRLAAREAALAPQGVEVVGTLVQRRGVSRGGVKSMDAPMSSATFFGSGKARELESLVRERQAEIVYVLNRLSGAQLARLSSAVACRVISSPDEADQEEKEPR